MKGLVFTYVLTYGGALASLYDPFIGLLVYICFAIIKPDLLWSWAVPQGNYSRIVAIALLVGWVFKGFGSWQFGSARWIVVALLGYWLWAFVGIYIGIDATRSWQGVESISKIALPFLVGVTTISSLRQLKLLAWVIVLSEGYLALEFNLSYLAGNNRLLNEGFGDMDNNCNAIALVSCVGLGFFLALHTREWWLKLLAFVSIILMTNAIFFSYSRGGMLALFITVGVSFFLIPKQPKHYVMYLLAVIVVWRLAGSSVMERFETIFADSEHRDASAESRLHLWRACCDSMLTTPLGLGADNFPQVVDRYGFYKGKEAHTLWLTVGAECGFPGLVCLLLFYILCIIKLWPLTQERKTVADPWFRYFARMVIAALVGFGVSAQFVSLKYLEHPFYITLIGVVVLKLVSTPQNQLLPVEEIELDPSPPPVAV
jgi:probable O-glycosylation ligase (exosortase A-associated)